MKSPVRIAAGRALGFFALWIVLMPSAKPGDLVVGLVATVLATAASVRLLPPATGPLRFGALLAYLPHFLWQSILAGWDIARRALDPRLPLNPGFVTCRTQLPPGHARNGFKSITSLLPGSLPTEDEQGAILYHCLDVTQPVAEQTAAEERALAGALSAGERHV
jgi:multicomponent Na+:H+ antiporter subunit E